MASKSAGEAANIIRVMSDKQNRDPRFLEYVVNKIKRGGGGRHEIAGVKSGDPSSQHSQKKHAI